MTPRQWVLAIGAAIGAMAGVVAMVFPPAAAVARVVQVAAPAVAEGIAPLVSDVNPPPALDAGR